MDSAAKYTLPVSREEAQKTGSRYYYTGNPCRHGHDSRRLTSNARCVECGLESRRRWHRKNPNHYREYYRQWRKNNLDRQREYAATRHAAKLQRTPAWADRDAIQAIYDSARDMIEKTGLDHHVDHIIPLRGDTVCGLHVPNNLQVIPASENLTKNKSYNAEADDG